MAALKVPSTPETVRWGRVPSATSAPVGSLRSGDEVEFDTVSHEGILADQGRDPRAFFAGLGIAPGEVLEDAVRIAAEVPRDPAVDGPHVVTGPVVVVGARPGDLLRVEMVGLERRCDFGLITNRHGKGVLAGEFPEPDAAGAEVPVVSQLARVDRSGRGELRDRSGHSVSFALREFLGLIGVAAASEEELLSTPPRSSGGNLDVRHVGLGASWLFPVQVEGALLFVGDPHFAQGNGEVALTAFEAPLRARLRVQVEDSSWARRIASEIAHPVAETPTHHIVVGLGATLDTAMAAAVRHALSFVVLKTGLERQSALAYLSAAADFEVSQAVNGVKGIHCLINKAGLDAVG